MEQNNINQGPAVVPSALYCSYVIIFSPLVDTHSDIISTQY